MRLSRFAATASLTVLLYAAGSVTPASAVTMSTFVSSSDILGAMSTTGTIGFAYAGDKFVGSIQRDGTNVLFQTDLSGGSVTTFASTVSLAGTASSEHYVASSLGLGGFPSRDIYVASGGGVMHISNDGTSSNLFVTGLSGTVRGILFDPVGTFGNNMIVTTTSGNIYIVNSAGLLVDGAGTVTGAAFFSTGEDTEGLDVAQTGPNAGQLIVASEGSGKIRAITTAGISAVIATVASAEELSVVPLGINTLSPVEGFYGANYAVDIQKAPASDFVGLAGDIIITGEGTGVITDLHWNGSTYVASTLGNFPNQPEDGIFVSTAIVNPGPTPAPEPATISLLGLGLAALAARRRRKV